MMTISIPAVHSIINERISKRALDPDRPVTPETLLSLIEAARWAPSCNNEQPWRFIFWDKNKDQSNWHKAFSCLAEGNQIWVQHAPVLAVSLAYQLNKKGLPNYWAQYDTGAAALNLCLQATALEMIAHQMGGFDPKQLMEAFSLPETITPMSMIAIGYPGDTQRLPEKLQIREMAQRERRPVNELFFESSWNHPIKN
ncbi:MAG: nitroreductase family protein [Pseudomonadota bacterium]|nr:nitroreductase family protein [Pseudomonadota bacterium]